MMQGHEDTTNYGFVLTVFDLLLLQKHALKRQNETAAI